MTKYVWSPALGSAVKNTQYWKTSLRIYLNKIKTSELIKKGLEYGYCDDTPMDQKGIKIEITESYRCLNRVEEKDRGEEWIF